MKMEMEIVSKEHIKPSAPTPHHHKTHKLSLLDQIVPPIYAPLVLYYPNLENIPNNADFVSQTTDLLKQSLSATLSRFYPLAGRMKDKLSIDCNDEGVLFVATKFSGNLSDFLKNPDPQACRGHIPSQLTWAEPGPGSYVAMIQVNYFDCGGIAIGSLFLHKVVDGVSIITFIEAWAAAARGSGDQTVFPDYTAQSIFPQNESMQRETHLFSAMRKYFKFGKTVMRRYVFDATSISKLKTQLSSLESLKRHPSRVEVLSAFMWKCFMIACATTNTSSSGDDDDDDRKNSTSLVTHVMNVRRKADPPCAEDSFGNLVWLVPASSSNDDSDRDMKQLFSKVRSAIEKVDVDFVKKMQGDEGFSGYCKNLEETWGEFPEKADYLAITSWCNFGFYGVDFGWGKPVWISKCDAGSDTEWPFINVLWLMDTRNGDGIEAWMTLDEQYFAAFDDIQELRDLAFIDPSPLSDVTTIKQL